jgi:hypothetical protein
MEKLERYTADTVTEVEKLQQQTTDTVAEVDASVLEGTWRGIIDFLWSGRQTG